MKRREFLNLSARTMLATPFIVSDASGLENLLANSSEENITWEQHQEDINKLLKRYKDYIKEHHNGNYKDGEGNLIEAIIPLDENKSKQYMEYTNSYMKAKEDLKKKKYIVTVMNEFETKFPLQFFGSKYGPLKKSDVAIIKFDPDENLFYFMRYLGDGDIFYIKDVRANGMIAGTEDQIETNESVWSQGHTFEGPIVGKEKQWKLKGYKLENQYRKEIHKIVKDTESGKIEMFFWFYDLMNFFPTISFLKKS